MNLDSKANVSCCPSGIHVDVAELPDFIKVDFPVSVSPVVKQSSYVSVFKENFKDHGRGRHDQAMSKLGTS